MNTSSPSPPTILQQAYGEPAESAWKRYIENQLAGLSYDLARVRLDQDTLWRHQDHPDARLPKVISDLQESLKKVQDAINIVQDRRTGQLISEHQNEHAIRTLKERTETAIKELQANVTELAKSPQTSNTENKTVPFEWTRTSPTGNGNALRTELVKYIDEAIGALEQRSQASLLRAVQIQEAAVTQLDQQVSEVTRI